MEKPVKANRCNCRGRPVATCGRNKHQQWMNFVVGGEASGETVLAIVTLVLPGVSLYSLEKFRLYAPKVPQRARLSTRAGMITGMACLSTVCERPNLKKGYD